MADESDVPTFDLGALGHSLLKQQEGSTERAAFLEELRRKVKAGEYLVNAETLADKLLEAASEEILPEERQRDSEEDAK